MTASPCSALPRRVRWRCPPRSGKSSRRRAVLRAGRRMSETLSCPRWAGRQAAATGRNTGGRALRRDCPALRRRLADMGIAEAVLDQADKRAVLSGIMERCGVVAEEVAFIGDDTRTWRFLVSAGYP